MNPYDRKYRSVVEFPSSEVDALESILLDFNLTVDDFLEWAQSKPHHQAYQQKPLAGISLNEMFGTFLNSLQKTPITNHKKLRLNSIREYERVIARLQPYCISYTGGLFDPSTLAEACLEFVTSFSKSGKSTATVNKWTAVIRRFLKFVQFTYATGDLNLPELAIPDEPLPIALDKSQVAELFSTASRADNPIRVRFLITFLLATGLRRDEFRQVQRKDVNLRTQSVKVRHAKNGRMREIPFASNFSEKFEVYFDIYNINHPEHFIYGNKSNLFEPVSNSAIDDSFHRLAIKMKGYVKGDPIYGYHLHCLRHTYATHLLRNKVSLRVISQLLGHSGMRSTMRYTVLNTEQLREDAAEGFAFLEQIILGVEDSESKRLQS